ncbi:GNAT family N-acetyltransferase [Mesorhizobium muleiense]|uniref:GNAT family N-acetyltransferase n=1 Tax=Mesorhizobium muleiense TaxID=1004279 RepID=UPI001F2E3A18|nr:GNAT family N-acetyltransferase [Mesorhizobium muleiense]MCF6114782.1 GNAT family N-acetyltransferase [Mesorhizobium muleiense]
MGAIEIEEVCSITPAAAQAIGELVRQLSSSAKVPSESELEQIAHSPATVLLAARTSNEIVGMLTLVIFRIPTGVRGIIEDVVVDEAYRGQGIAEALTREALARSEAAGARTIDLTSRPSREAANRLYQKLGFQKRDSNVYRFSFAEGVRKSPL